MVAAIAMEMAPLLSLRTLPHACVMLLMRPRLLLACTVVRALRILGENPRVRPYRIRLPPVSFLRCVVLTSV